jgi:uncharacterized metal-binding protein YceD (DUF177 family)
LAPDVETRRRIAQALDLASLEFFEVEVTLSPSPAGWSLSGVMRARLEQICGITLEPLPMEIQDRFSIGLAEQVQEPGEIIITLDDESPDIIEDGRIDLGQYAVEQLALRLDPFPRKPGAEFVQPPEPAEISPFAALRKLQGDEGS